jgi:Fe-S cluster biogenesis protein NfuA
MRTLLDRIEFSLNKLRPYLKREGGDIQIDHYDKATGILYVEMLGACKGCAFATSDITDFVEVLLMQEIPQITAVKLINAIDDGFRSLQQQLLHPKTIQKQKEEEKQKA